MLFLYALSCAPSTPVRLRQGGRSDDRRVRARDPRRGGGRRGPDRVGSFVRQAAGVLRPGDRQRDRRCGRGLTSLGPNSGTAAVEFALVLPLVLVVALALVQTGLLVRDRLLVEAAARAGARAAAIQADPGAVNDAVVGSVDGLDTLGHHGVDRTVRCPR